MNQKNLKIFFLSILISASILFISSFTFNNLYSQTKDEKVSQVENPRSTEQNKHASKDSSHGDKYAEIYLLLFFIILGAVIGRRFIAKKLNQPEVLGELIIGVILGLILYQLDHPLMTLLTHQDEVNKIIHNSVTENLNWAESIQKNISPEAFGPEGYGNELKEILTSPDFFSNNMIVQIITLFSSFGVLILLFLVGLETSIEEMFEVGKTALIVAILGVVLPMAFGYFTSYLLLPGYSSNLHLFIGATLCATSIGITARVFKDLRKINIPEAKIVLGAAVIDDVLGLIVLAVVAGIISSGGIDIENVSVIVLKAVIFLSLLFYLGKKYLRRQIKFAAIADIKNVTLLFPFALMILLAWLSDRIGLASIVGAFAAGLIIKEEYFDEYHKDNSKSVKSLVEPIETIFAPVFFVMMGMQVDLTSFMKTEILLLSLILTAVAILGKLLSSIFVKDADKRIIGIGMIPRGEVGLIFAGIGKSLGILDSSLFSSIIIVVILTTFITPPGLKWAFSRYKSKHHS